MRISDWSSDVCSSDLCLDMALRVPRERRDAVAAADAEFAQGPRNAMRAIVERGVGDTANTRALPARHDLGVGMPFGGVDRKSVGKGKGVSVREELGGRRNHKKNKKQQ